MNTGIQDGYNLAWKIALVLNGRSDPRLLETYNEERLPNAENLTRTTDRFFGLVADPNPLASFFRIYVFPLVAKFFSRLPTVRRFVFPRISQIAISYRHSSLSRNSGTFKIKAGDRMPYFKIDGESIYNKMLEPKFHLLAFGGNGFVELDNNLKELIDVRILPLAKETTEIFGNDKPFILVVRPDNYIGLISNQIGIDSLRKYLNDVLGQ
jgi:hypothetical protein